MITYDGVHKRLQNHKGPAKDQLCVQCGDQAGQWSYDHQDPDELICERTGSPYSTDEDHYVALCVACHMQVDRDHRGGTPHGNEKKTHCPAGHEYTPENTEIQPSTGWRVCRTCHQEAARRQWANKAARD